MSDDERVVAKMALVDKDDNYLIMYRSDHPLFGDDPDLPGGSQEDDESNIDTVLREVEEEIGVRIDSDATKQVFVSTEYSSHGTEYVLFVTRVAERPEIDMSWEHSSYEWIPRDKFVEISRGAVDSYMHMVADVVASGLNVS